ncbi:hypothetical protein [Saccharibacillus sacchari]|nr:hypothetical protein [Saccharibacillus sacchari]
MVVQLVIAAVLLILIYVVVKKVSYSKRVQHIAKTQEKRFMKRFEEEE